MRAPTEAEIERLARMLRAEWHVGMGRGRFMVRDMIVVWLKQCERAERKEGKANGRVGQ